MFPCSSSPYRGYLRGVYAVFGRKLFKATGGRSYILNVDIREFSFMVSGALWSFVPFLCKHIINVLFLRAKKQVIRPNATSVVAFMEHAKARRYRPYINFPGQSVRFAVCVPFFCLFWESPIAPGVFGSNPFPAIMKRDHFNAIKKSSFKLHREII